MIMPADTLMAKPHARPQPLAAPLVALRGIGKRFANVVANESIDLELRAGEVHVLLGENGAGKSTLVALLSGLLQPDAGQIIVDGSPMRILSPGAALALGIGTVFQHVMLSPALTVAENLLLGQGWWRRPARAALDQAVGAIARDFGLNVDLDAVTGELSLGEQQQVEIIRALLRQTRLLIFDESTSMLTPQGIEELGALMRRLVERGLAIVFITHKLDEARRFGDRITVLRLGRKVGEISSERLEALDDASAHQEIVSLMFETIKATGEAVVGKERKRVAMSGKPLLELRDITVTGQSGSTGIEAISLSVWPGEVLGIAGIDGNGQKLIAEAIAGQRRLDSGKITFGGIAIDNLDVGARRKLGIRYLTDDRLSEGSVAAFAVSANLLLKEIGKEPFWSRGFTRTAVIDVHANAQVKEFDVRTPSIRTPIGKLSGGNIQKALLARELFGDARLVIFSKPTYGLDHNNIVTSRRRIAEVGARGIAVILISTDLEEILALSDRIAVMSRGRIAGILENTGDARLAVGGLMVGGALEHG